MGSVRKNPAPCWADLRNRDRSQSWHCPDDCQRSDHGSAPFRSIFPCYQGQQGTCREQKLMEQKIWHGHLRTKDSRHRAPVFERARAAASVDWPEAPGSAVSVAKNHPSLSVSASSTNSTISDGDFTRTPCKPLMPQFMA